MPYVFGGISHILPLMVFQHNYISQIKGLNNYFLAESSKHRILKNLGMKDLPFDYSIKKEHDANVTSQLNYIGKQIKSIEENAIRYLNPDYLLEDFDYNSTELSLKYNIPRISIQRSGYFNCRSAQDNNIRHMHSLEKLSEGKSIFRHVKTTESSPVVGILEEHSNNCIKIIPGIPSIEQKPSCLLDESKYFYCGPLIVKDRPTDTLKTNLAKFYSRHTLKKRVFITTGAFESSSIDRYINILLDRNYAIVTNECKINHNSIFTKKDIACRLYMQPV